MQPSARVAQTDAFDDVRWKPDAIVGYRKPKEFAGALRVHPDFPRCRASIEPVAERVFDERLEKHRRNERISDRRIDVDLRRQSVAVTHAMQVEVRRHDLQLTIYRDLGVGGVVE